MVDTGWMLCHYAANPAARPGCQVTAVVRRGSIPLCASCDAQRSTLGKGQPATPIPVPAAASILDWIGQARTRLLDAEAEVTAAVTRARQHGCTWAAIAACLDTTRQAAQQRFGSGPGARRRGNSPPRAVQAREEH